MRKPNIAILGATGVVGREITKITDELGVEFDSIKFLSSAKSAGTKLTFQGKEYTLEEATPESFEGIDIVMASAGRFSVAVAVGLHTRDACGDSAKRGSREGTVFGAFYRRGTGRRGTGTV